MFLEYIIFLKFLIFASILSSILFLGSFFLVFQQPDIEKLSSYECGFNPWSDARSKFEVRFYLVAILFIIFDLEITFLLPWVITLYKISYAGYYVMGLFLFILTIDSFMNEWKVH